MGMQGKRAKGWIFAGGLLLLGVGGLALASQFQVWPFAAAEANPPQQVAPKEPDLTPVTPPVLLANGPKHAQPNQVLTLTLLQLHTEALHHFHSDPRNGLARMPYVYEKVVKEWKNPWLSPGELDKEDDAKPHPDLKKIHAASAGHFLNPAPITTEKLNRKDILAISVTDMGKWDKLNAGKKHWEAKNVDLIGLIYGPEPVAYVSEKLPDMDKTEASPKRPLDDFEVVGLTALKKGDEIFSRSREGVVRMLGALRANASCISCHEDKKEGDLLGAFSYTLREAEYQRKVQRFGAP